MSGGMSSGAVSPGSTRSVTSSSTVVSVRIDARISSLQNPLLLKFRWFGPGLTYVPGPRAVRAVGSLGFTTGIGSRGCAGRAMSSCCGAGCRGVTRLRGLGIAAVGRITRAQRAPGTVGRSVIPVRVNARISSLGQDWSASVFLRGMLCIKWPPSQGSLTFAALESWGPWVPSGSEVAVEDCCLSEDRASLTLLTIEDMVLGLRRRIWGAEDT